MVELVRAGRTPEELAPEFEPTAQSIWNWVRQADRDAGKRTDGPAGIEREKLTKLRRENARLRPRARHLGRGGGLVRTGEQGDPVRVYRFMRANPADRPASDLVRRNVFVAAPNQRWVADIRFVPTMYGFLFLAVVLDAWSRKIVGWAFASDLKTRVVLDALDMARDIRRPDDIIHHSDKGSQYTSLAFGNRCKMPVCAPRPALSATRMTTPCAKASSRPWNAS